MNSVVALSDPKVNPSAVRRCINCGLDWRPLTIPKAQFLQWERDQKRSIQQAEAFGEAEIDRLAREIVDKRRKGLPVETAGAESAQT